MAGRHAACESFMRAHWPRSLVRSEHLIVIMNTHLGAPADRAVELLEGADKAFQTSSSVASGGTIAANTECPPNRGVGQDRSRCGEPASGVHALEAAPQEPLRAHRLETR